MEEEEYTSGVETLSRLCDEQGLQHWDNEDIELDSHMFIDKAGNVHECWDSPHGMVNVVISMTPEQAVMLGAETCEMEYVNDWMGWHCKSCDNLRMGLPDQKPKYCPNCGKKVTS